MSMFMRYFCVGLLLCGLLYGAACESPVLPEGSVDEVAEQAGDAKVQDPGRPSDRPAPPDARPEPRSEPGGPDAPGPEPRTEPQAEPVVPERSQPEPSPERSTPPERTVPPEPTPGGEDLTKAGPFQTKELPVISLKVPASTGCKGQFCTIKLFVTLPDSKGIGSRKAPYPLAVFSNGFLLGASFYKSYAARLASWGYTVIRWDTNQESPFNNMEHDSLGAIVKEIINWAAAQNTDAKSPLNSMVSTSAVLGLGHSRGGKASTLAAQNDARIRGLFLIDPVDAPPPGKKATSAVAGMSKTKAKLAVIGADKGNEGFQPCAPKAHNYAKFYDASKTKSWELLLTDTGHMQFLDTRSGCLPCFACTNGKTPDTIIRQITQSAMVAWAESVIRARDISLFVSGKWLQDWRAKKALTSRNK